MTTSSEIDDQRRGQLKLFLTGCRSRLQPRDVGLPMTPRRRVTGLRREEIAELAGVSSDWYRWFESGRQIRVSFDFVARVADALCLTGDERATLFRLALPEVAAAIEPTLHPSSSALLECTSTLRKVVRRMWSASSLTEILTAASESAAETFNDADLLGVYQRIRIGEWIYPVVVNNERFLRRAADVGARLRIGLTPEQIDESMLQGALNAPGQVGTFRELLRGTAVIEHCTTAMEAEGFRDADTLAALAGHVGGTEATLFVSYLSKPKNFSGVDRMLLGTIADVLSLALRDAA